MDKNTERNLGTQPIAELMDKHNLKPNDLVKASTAQLTHKMVSRACKGRKLTPHIKIKVLIAFNTATESSYSQNELFNY